MNPRNPSIRSILLALVFATGLPLVGLLAYTIYTDANRAVAQASANVRSLNTIFAANVSRTLAANKEAMALLSKRPLIRAVDEAHCDPILTDFRTLFPLFANIGTIDLAGRIVCSAVAQPGGKPVSVAKTEWFQRALVEKRFIMGNPFIGPITGKWVSVLVYPIYDDLNILKGFVALPLDLVAYDPKISAAPMPPGTRYGLLGADGTLIWRNTDPDGLIGKDLRHLDLVQNLLATKDGLIETAGSDGIFRLYAITPVQEANWYSYVSIPSQPLYAAAKKNIIRNSLLALLSLLVLAGIAILLARRIALPAIALAANARAIKKGEYDVRAKAADISEMAEVAEEFNEMVESWQAAERQLHDLNIHLEVRVQARTAELKKANQELSAFSYAVSHDLRAPLRAIDGFCHMLLEDYGERLDDAGRGYLNRVRRASQHMAEIIDDMLGMARSVRDEMSCGVFDLSTLARTVAADIEASSPRAGVEWRIPDGIMAFGDENLLSVLLENLLGNAYKYTSKQASARIEIGLLPDKQDGKAVYFVKDDGVGFDMGHSGKLFGMFQRLHSGGDFDGHGIGLATVQRIIQRHGGEIWADSQVEQGATFFFTLADPQAGMIEACTQCAHLECEARVEADSPPAATGGRG